MTANETTNGFQGEYRWLSNFWRSPIEHFKREFPTGEHLYNAEKTLDEEWYEKIRLAPTPGMAKKFGRLAPIKPDWDKKYRIPTMTMVTMLKYQQNLELTKKLIATGDMKLVEYNTWHDNFWGICTCIKCNRKLGHNKLGELLMIERGFLQKRSI